ncbi:hypothetical protein EDD22DRAFT_735893, partial [Suillus occidentalis]
MLKTARKHNMSFAPIKLSKDLKDQMPAWLHLGAQPRTYNKNKDECLQTLHDVKSVKDLRSLARRLKLTNTHNVSATCHCDLCSADRLAGCKNPIRCAQVAQKILNNLNPTYNPNTSPKKDNLTLTHRRKEKNSQARTQIDGEITFDPSITSKNHLSECFRIFV